MSDEELIKYMRLSDSLAKLAASKGNTPVGCVIVMKGKIISQAQEAGSSKQDVTCHAEIEAIRKARKKIGLDMSDCTLVTTHEPCVMCGYAIRFHKIKTVVYKNKVKHLGSISSAMTILATNNVPEHWSLPPIIIQL
ncbi:MAG: tRNA(adenine34) deaminase [Saprospiraceae bacterium]|jgi:tRNA(adenine34) deaminase